MTDDIPQKANRVLNLILAGMVLILLRVWHLAVVQHEERIEEARKPQNRTIIEQAKRGTIRDRFNIPLAINKVQYNAAVPFDAQELWRVTLYVTSSAEAGQATATVEVTPTGLGRWDLLLFALPFVGVGFLWFRAIQRRRAPSRPPPNSF